MKKLLSCLICFSFIFASCTKDPGEGGGGTIKGKLYAKNVHDPNTTLNEDDGEPDEDVFISYGDKLTPDDDVKTSPDGSFEFKYLRKGKYTIFAYSLDKDNPSSDKKIAVIKTAELGDNKAEVTVDDFVVYKDADDRGTSSIKGRLYAKDYNSAYTAVLNEYYEAGERVYIVYGNDSILNDDMRTSYDGSYEFRNLREGTYKVYALSEDTTGAWNNMANPYAAQVPVMETVTISGKNKVMTVPTITIIK